MTDGDVRNGPQSESADEHDSSHDLERLDVGETNTVTMSVTIDVSDMDETQVEVIQKLARIKERGFEEIVAKNRDYGFSFLRSGAKLAATPGYTADTAVRSQMGGLLHRTGDKRERIIENVYGDGSTEVSDEPFQTAAECANYWDFMAFVLEHPALASSSLRHGSDGESDEPRSSSFLSHADEQVADWRSSLDDE
jgi:hypothetical protein